MTGSDDDSKHREAQPKPSQMELAERIRERLPSEPVPPDQLAELLARVLTVEVHELSQTRYQGPVPPPEMLAEYERAMPGLAKRLVARAEKEQIFRHELSREQVAIAKSGLDHKAQLSHRGQWLGFVIAMTAICGGIILLYNDKGTAGITAILAALVGLVAVFITGKIVELKQSKRLSEELTDE